VRFVEICQPGWDHHNNLHKGLIDRCGSIDLHATLLALMGLDHEQLVYPYAGRDFRLTDVRGNVVREVFA
jgi:hypothetical protein